VALLDEAGARSAPTPREGWSTMVVELTFARAAPHRLHARTVKTVVIYADR